jgi:hypothetical protein
MNIDVPTLTGIENEGDNLIDEIEKLLAELAQLEADGS